MLIWMLYHLILYILPSNASLIAFMNYQEFKELVFMNFSFYEHLATISGYLNFIYFICIPKLCDIHVSLSKFNTDRSIQHCYFQYLSDHIQRNHEEVPQSY